MRTPPEGTVEAWAWAYVTSTDLEHKLSPPPPPEVWEEAPEPRILARPGRAPGLELAERSPRSPRPGALKDPGRRAQLLHTFLHHELQAAELMAWALLRFVGPGVPEELRQGLLKLALDEVRHARMYAAALGELGGRYGDHAVNDWFWRRVPNATDPLGFVSLMGIGLEGANLDHATRFARLFREAGDERSAVVQEVIARDEIGHVRFALHWFRALAGGFDFARWRAALPPPLSPLMLRHQPLAAAHRREAGLDDTFLAELSRWTPAPSPAPSGS